MDAFFVIVALVVSTLFPPLHRAAVFSPQTSSIHAQQVGEQDARLPENKLRNFWITTDRQQPNVTAQAVLVIDADTGEELFRKGDPNTPYPIASLTKLMTARVVMSAGDAHDVFMVSPEDYVTIGRAGLKIGTLYTKDDLMAALLIDSSNTAARTLTRSAGLTVDTFRTQARAEAYRLGLTTTQWDEPTGLSPNNKASAHDVASLLHYDLDDPYVSSFLRTSQYTLSTGDALTTTNLLRLPGAYNDRRVVAGKTGYIEESGFSVAVLGQCAPHREVIAVVFGSATHFDRFRDIRRVVDWTCSHVHWLDVGSFQQ